MQISEENRKSRQPHARRRYRESNLSQNFYLLAKLADRVDTEECSAYLRLAKVHLKLADMILTNSEVCTPREQLEKTLPQRRRLAKRAMRYYRKMLAIESRLTYPENIG